MDPSLVGYLSLASVFVLIILRVPVAISLVTVSLTGLFLIAGPVPTLSFASTVPYNFASSWTLSSVPMFLLMGYIAYHAGLTKGIFEAARVWLGRMPGGLAIASLTGASGFAAITGSSVACSAAIGRIAVPEMAKQGYDIRIATGSVAAGGTIGALIPPSILLILFGIQAEVSIKSLFLGGLVVGIISATFYVFAVWRSYVFHPESMPRAQASTWEEKRRATLEIWPVLLLVFVVFGGMFSGYFTATEAGAVGAFFSFVIGVLKRSLSRHAFLESCIDTLLASGGLFMIAIGANLFTRMVAMSGLSADIGMWIDEAGFGPFQLLLVITLIYLALGMVLEPIGAMLLTLPLFLPIIDMHGIDRIWFGILLAKLLEIGMITPPVGLNVFVIHSVAKDYVRLEQIFAGVIPFLIADLLLVAVILSTYSFF